MNELEIIFAIYKFFISQIDNKKIPINLRPSSVIGTVQKVPVNHQ